MAAPRNAAQLVFELIADNGEARASAAATQNYRDYLDLRHLTRSTLHDSLAVPQLNAPVGIPFAGGVAPAANQQNDPAASTAQAQALQNNAPFNPPPPYLPQPAPPTPRTLPITIPQTLQTLLGGATCNDTIGGYRNRPNVPVGGVRPCPNRAATAWGPGTVPTRLCANPNPQTHPASPPGTFRVCHTCEHENWTNRLRWVMQDLYLERRAIMCKKCSLAFKARHPNGTAGPGRYELCGCLREMRQGWFCFECMNEVEGRVMAVGADAKRRLLRTHRVRNRRTGRKEVRFVDNNLPGNVRQFPACPTPGCGGRAWTRVHTEPPDLGLTRFMNRRAADMCLCCGGGRCM